MSALQLSPLRTPVLLVGAIVAFLVHIAAMHLLPAQAALRTEPVGLTTWVTLLALALTVLVAVEVHKWTWARRYPGVGAAVEREEVA
jgi:hypothetical protein